MEDIIDKLRRIGETLDDEASIKIDDVADELWQKYDDLMYDKECEIEDLKENAIVDLDKFKRQLKQQNLMSKALEDFIENYMRFDNV